MSDAALNGLEARDLHKSYTALAAVAGVSLSVRKGEFFTILGPSGSGKTTLLKLIAGFEIPDRGDILLDGANVTESDPTGRNIGMVFQNYALFPHMTVRQNVGFPLKMRRLRRAEIGRRVDEMLALVGLSALEHRTPRELSGGQQQRVALARALVFHPSLLLLDEPFSALDRKLRDLMQLEVRRLQKELDLATIFITHDQEEALIMSDRIGVLNEGRLEQVGSPQDVYDTPANRFVADFVGELNLLAGSVEADGERLGIRLERGPLIRIGSEVAAGAVGRRVRVLIRPERFVDTDPRQPDEDGGNHLRGTVTDRIYTGISQKCRVRTPEGLDLLAILRTDGGSRRYAAGDQIRLGFDPADLRLIGGEAP